jgi:hypothetical protein
MAKLKRGTTFVDGTGPTPDDFNDHIEDALLYDTTSACCATGVNLAIIEGGPGPPTGADGDPYVAAGGELQVHNGTGFASITDDMATAVTVTLQNNTGGNATAGDVVILDDGADLGFQFVTSTDETAKVFGVLKQNLVNTEVGEVYVRGVCEVNIDTNFSDPVKAPPGSLISASPGTTGSANQDAKRNLTPREASYFGITFGTVTGEGLSGGRYLFTCYIWK